MPIQSSAIPGSPAGVDEYEAEDWQHNSQSDHHDVETWQRDVLRLLVLEPAARFDGKRAV
jgi:hypothetical protein